MVKIAEKDIFLNNRSNLVNIISDRLNDLKTFEVTK